MNKGYGSFFKMSTQFSFNWVIASLLLVGNSHIVQNRIIWSWGGASGVEITGCPLRGPGFDFEHSHGAFQRSVNNVPRDLIHPSDPLRH